jgi:hypothetical protein
MYTNINVNFFFPLALQPNSAFGRLHEIFRLVSVTRSRTVGRTPWTGDQLVARRLPVLKHRKTHRTQTLNTHARSGIRTHGPGVRASEDSSCLKPLGYRDRQTRPLQFGNCIGKICNTWGWPTEVETCSAWYNSKNCCVDDKICTW